MPDWNSKPLVTIKDFVILFERAMADKDVDAIPLLFHKDAVLPRGPNFKGISRITAWYAEAWAKFKDFQFVLKDASAGVLPDGTAKCILWFEIVRKKSAKKQIHVESLDLKRFGRRWMVTACFGIGYSPRSHRKYFPASRKTVPFPGRKK